MKTEAQSGKVMPFEQQPRESAKAFAAFRAYLDMGPQRSLRELARKLDKSVTLLGNWSAKYDWPARVQAYAGHLALVERKAAEQAAALYGADREKRREVEREDEWAMRTELMQAARKVLEKFRDGERGATLGDVARALDIAVKLGRLSSGMKVEDDAEDSGAPDVNVLVAIDLALDKIYGPEKPAAPAARVVDVEVVAVKAESEKAEGGKQ